MHPRSFKLQRGVLNFVNCPCLQIFTVDGKHDGTAQMCTQRMCLPGQSQLPQAWLALSTVDYSMMLGCTVPEPTCLHACTAKLRRSCCSGFQTCSCTMQACLACSHPPPGPSSPPAYVPSLPAMPSFVGMSTKLTYRTKREKCRRISQIDPRIHQCQGTLTRFLY